jgi:Raf kinase inhibitor-like YbhB/YbcL family protein
LRRSKENLIVTSQHRACFVYRATLLILALAAPVIMAPAVPQSKGRTQSMLQLTSTAFHPEENIPVKFTCDDRNISPELSWGGAPAGTKSFALVMHDPDAPIAGGYTHWLVYNIPPTADSIPENAPNQDHLPGGGMQGKNDSGTYGYTGPCPPSGTHRYYFRLYALDVELDPHAGSNKAGLERAMQGHILAQAELLGRYKRSAGKAA